MKNEGYREGGTKLFKRSVTASKEVGMMAWWLHRITGVILVVYLYLHIDTISSVLAGGGSFDQAMAKFHTPFWVFADLLLLAAVLYHGLNGIRVTIFDFGMGVKQQKILYGAVVIISVLIFFVAFYVSIPLIFG